MYACAIFTPFYQLSFFFNNCIDVLCLQQSQQMGQMFQPSGAGYFVPTMPQAQRGFFNPAQMAQVRPSPRWQTPQQATRPAVPTGAAAGFQAMQTGTTQIRQARPTTQGTVRAAMNARPITGQQPTAAQRVAGKS